MTRICHWIYLRPFRWHRDCIYSNTKPPPEYSWQAYSRYQERIVPTADSLLIFAMLRYIIYVMYTYPNCTDSSMLLAYARGLPRFEFVYIYLYRRGPEICRKMKFCRGAALGGGGRWGIWVVYGGWWVWGMISKCTYSYIWYILIKWLKDVLCVQHSPTRFSKDYNLNVQHLQVIELPSFLYLCIYEWKEFLDSPSHTIQKRTTMAMLTLITLQRRTILQCTLSSVE